VRKYVMVRRGLIACDARRKPVANLSPTAKTEVDYLLARLARWTSAPSSSPGWRKQSRAHISPYSQAIPS
jgi:hypothetical protein